MKLSQWCKKQGVSYRTGWNHFKSGKLKNAYRLESGAIIVPDFNEKTKKECVVVYARVSSSENKNNLESQAERLSQYCNAKGWIVDQIVKECASGLNDSRPKLQKLLKNKDITKIVVEHKDRLTRFGFEYINTLFQGEIVVLNKSETKNELMEDFVNIVTSFCARIYGQRRSKRKTEKLIEELQHDS